MATPRTTRTKQAEMRQPQMLTGETPAAAAQPLLHDKETAPIASLALTVRKKGLALAEKILDKCENAPLDTIYLNNVTKAIELYNAFK